MKRDIGTDRGGKPAGEEQVRQAAATSAEQGLQEGENGGREENISPAGNEHTGEGVHGAQRNHPAEHNPVDRKSTRLNSSHIH